MKEESTEGDNGDTRRQLREKLASLSQPQLERARGALSMIWNGVTGPLDLPVPQLEPRSYEKCTLSHRVQLALLRSISTGFFVDVQFYAYNAVYDNLPVDLKPLFTSSIVIEEQAAAIAMRECGSTSQWPVLLRSNISQRNYGDRIRSRMPGRRVNRRLRILVR